MIRPTGPPEELPEPGEEAEVRPVERALRESESRLRAILECAGEAMYGVDLRGLCTFANPACAERLGYESTEELVGHNMHRLIHHSRPDGSPYPVELCRIYQAYQRGEGTFVDDEVLWRRDGTSFPAEYRSYPLWIHGRIEGAVVTFSDISERLRLEAERRALDAAMQREQKRESLEVMAAGAAHDFNNLLTVILGNATFAATRSDAPDWARRSFLQIEGAARRAAELVHQMLVFAGKTGAVMRPTNLSVVVEEMRELLRASISKRVQLVAKLAPDVLSVNADPTQLRQVLMNLVTNAAEACETTGSRVVVRTGVERCEAKHLTEMRLGEGLQPGVYAFLETQDDGCGMDAETVARAFDPFFTTKFTGRGLGLAATSGIVRSHRGALRIESEPGSGTRIRVYLPVCEGPGETEADGIAGSDPRALEEPVAGPCVLVVDDEPAVCELAAAVLEKAGFRVQVAGDATVALRFLDRAEAPVGAVLLDLTMPGLSVDDALRAIASRRPGLPILLTSGYPESDVLARVGAGPVAGFLPKPWDPAALVRRIRDLTRA